MAERENAVPAQPDARTILHVLNRLSFGPRLGDVERVRRMGLSAYIDEQLHPERIPDTAVDARLAEFTTLTMSSRELAEKYFLPADALKRDQQIRQAKAAAKTAQGAASTDMTPATPAKSGAQVSPEQRQIQQAQATVMNELMQARVLRATVSDRQLDEVLVDFWFNHFNVFVGKNQVRQYLTEYERDTIRPHVLGSFRDLLGAVAHSPAMLYYLDNWESSAANAPAALPPQAAQRLANARLTPAQRQQLTARLQQMQKTPAKKAPSGLNENYGRELMELHTLGVDGGYTQADVVNVARALTGWTINTPRQSGSFMFNPRMHDTGAKTILGVDFPAGHGQDEGERVLDLLARHPSTAHHIAFELAQRFVADEPPPALVDRAAKTFLETNGDLREVVRVIITSQEFFAADADRAKVKSPLEFVVSAVRASGATVMNAEPLVQELRLLGMPLYSCQPPTGYSMTADAWVNTGALLNRMNFALQLVGGGGQTTPPRGRGAGASAAGANGQGRAALLARPLVAQGRGAAQQLRAPLQLDLHALAPDTTDATRDHVIQLLFAGHVSDTTRQTLAKATTPQQLVALALGSPEFQKR